MPPARPKPPEPVIARRDDCSIAASLEIVGERWSLLALREITYGITRFDQIAGYTGASRNILADRLRSLESAGVVERRQYSEHPPRFEYHLTPSGAELAPVLLALAQWGDKWRQNPPVNSFDHDCGEPLEVDYTCRHCHRPLTADAVRLRSPTKN